MGAATSSFARGAPSTAVFASPVERAAFEKLVGETPLPRDDAAFETVLSARRLTALTQGQVEVLSREYAATLCQNSLHSGNFRVLLRIVIQSLPLSCSMDRKTPEELAADLTDGKKSVEAVVNQTVNALYLVRHFAMQFVEKQDEVPLLAHFNLLAPGTDYNSITASQWKGDGVINFASEAPIGNGRGYDRQQSTDDLAARFIDTLVSTLVEYSPTPRTYEVHVEVLNTLIVLLASVAFPRHRSKQEPEDQTHLQNPFLHMLMASAQANETHAAGLVHRLLKNYMDHVAAPPASRDSGSFQVALQNAQETSLIKISEATNQAEDLENFSYLTLEGVGAIASSIFRFPLNFYQYFVTSDSGAYPITDRSVLLLLILLQSCRDSDSPSSNPFRDALCSMSNSESSSKEDSTLSPASYDGRAANVSGLPFSKLFASIGKNAPYESSHLLLYSLMYTNSMMLDWCVANCDVTHLMLPLLETLYHAKSVEPSRLYMLVIVLLTFTQDPTFVSLAHTKLIVHDVPWYSERYILDVSLGSLMMVIFTRLIFRNITHFQDSFIHLNAFAGLSNLARSAENIHVYAAQSIVGLIEMLTKKETKLVGQMERMSANLKGNTSEFDVLSQKRTAYVEFIRLLLGVVSSCLKAKLLPRNPQLIYSLVYRAETFALLEKHSDFAFHVHNGPVWKTLARFRALVDSKTTNDDVLDVDTVLAIIRSECVSLLASSATAGTGAAALSSRYRTAEAGSAMPLSPTDEEEACYRYEEETEPEQFFIPYIWKLVFEQTPEFCWNVDKITLFVPAKAVITDG